MLKKRIIFVIYYANGSFFLSRNFKLQKIGSVEYLFDKFGFADILQGLDELVVLNVEKNHEDFSLELYNSFINKLLEKAFVPITLGGGLNSEADVNHRFSLGCDKVLFNTALFENIQLVENTILRFGSQAVVANLDVLTVNNEYCVFSNNGIKLVGTLDHACNIIKSLSFGELFLNSIDRDGTGFGPDINLIEKISILKPLIISGGYGKPDHFNILNLKNVDAAATGNIFNFIKGGLNMTRTYCKSINIRR